jgi:hypothetical protein
MIFIRRVRELTFFKRLVRMAVFWGIPIICFELVFIPRYAWGKVFVIVVLVTLLGVVFGALLEHWFVGHSRKGPG